MCDKVPRECSDAFIDINKKLAVLPGIAKDLREVHKIVYGNGNPSEGMMVRLDQLEKAKEDVRSNWKTIRRRMIDIMVAFVLLGVGMIAKGYLDD